MIREQWYAVISSREVRPGKLLGTVRMGENLLFFRKNDGTVACLVDHCAHRGAKLSVGKHEGDSVACPFHGLRYDAQGKCILIPANGNNAPIPPHMFVGAYPAVERHGFIWIYWGEHRDDIGSPPFFENIPDTMSWSEFSDYWPVHYSRVIENQLDVVHLPFVHYNTIGRGGKTLVNGPVEVQTGKRIAIWVYNETDSGQEPKNAESLPKPDPEKQHLEFIFPNIWQNYITQKIRVTAFFVPIDDNGMRIYLRFYQSVVKVPAIRELIHFFGNRMNDRIQKQDKRVVVTQEPKKSSYLSEEKLIPGDRPIATYRKVRQQLKESYGGR